MRGLAFSALCLLLVCGAHASIIGGSHFKIDFRRPDDANAKATWSPAEHVNITPWGLGWDSDPQSMYDGWIQTQAIAVGISWRPARSVQVSVHVLPGAGNVYVRYSADASHWSDWQEIRPGGDQQRAAGIYFGVVSVPRIVSEDYDKLLQEYGKLDVPWKSDEEAACQWIVKRDPAYFHEHRPFVGYIQVLWELEFRGGRRVPGMTVDTDFAVNGMHQPPKDSHEYAKREGPWRFKGD